MPCLGENVQEVLLPAPCSFCYLHWLWSTPFGSWRAERKTEPPSSRKTTLLQAIRTSFVAFTTTPCQSLSKPIEAKTPLRHFSKASLKNEATALPASSSTSRKRWLRWRTLNCELHPRGAMPHLQTPLLLCQSSWKHEVREMQTLPLPEGRRQTPERPLPHDWQVPRRCSLTLQPSIQTWNENSNPLLQVERVLFSNYYAGDWTIQESIQASFSVTWRSTCLSHSTATLFF